MIMPPNITEMDSPTSRKRSHEEFSEAFNSDAAIKAQNHHDIAADSADIGRLQVNIVLSLYQLPQAASINLDFRHRHPTTYRQYFSPLSSDSEQPSSSHRCRLQHPCRRSCFSEHPKQTASSASALHQQRFYNISTSNNHAAYRYSITHRSGSS